MYLYKLLLVLRKAELRLIMEFVEISEELDLEIPAHWFQKHL